jgi:hypothetical protein
VTVVLVTLAVAALIGVAWRWRAGRLHAARRASLLPVWVREQLELPGGQRATLLQFSSAFCQPCRVTRLTLQRASSLVPGVAHVEVDAESHLDVVRALHVTRTPTTLVLDRDGREVRRATGAPRLSAVLAALDCAGLDDAGLDGAGLDGAGLDGAGSAR